jgi:DNA-binding MarR family transcriptional regulator
VNDNDLMERLTAIVNRTVAINQLAQPVTPYAGTSGWSGSETSRERAIRNDADGTTARNQKTALYWLAENAYHGMTWKDLSDRTGMHHGTSSGVLSVLHKAGVIVRLTDKRDRCAIYVLPENVDGRTVSIQKPKCCKNCGAEQ